MIFGIDHLSRLPLEASRQRGEFNQENPTDQIAAIVVVQGENTLVLTTITGVDKTVPEVQINSSGHTLVLSLTPEAIASSPSDIETVFFGTAFPINPLPP